MQVQRKAYAKTVSRAQPVTTSLPSKSDAREARVAAIIEKRSSLRSLPDRLAGDSLCYKSWIYEGARERFPDNPELRWVDRYYPYAEGGPLAMDTPVNEQDWKRARDKEKAVRGSGLRFYIVDTKKSLEQMIDEISLLEAAK
jgi:hypothetical protein